MREEKFNAILSNVKIPIPWMNCSVYIVGSIILSFFLTAPVSVIPLHNALHFPEYWYESNLPLVCFALFAGFYIPIRAGYYMNVGYIKGMRYIIIICTTGTLISSLMLLVAYYTWTNILHYQYPIPFINYGLAYIDFVTLHIGMWFCLTSESRIYAQKRNCDKLLGTYKV